MCSRFLLKCILLWGIAILQHSNREILTEMVQCILNMNIGNCVRDRSQKARPILMFVDFCKHKLPLLDSVDGYVGGLGMYAVVRCLDGEPMPLKDSAHLLTGKRHLELTIVPTTIFKSPYASLTTSVVQTTR
jgi:hypothetical protein